MNTIFEIIGLTRLGIKNPEGTAPEALRAIKISLLFKNDLIYFYATFQVAPDDMVWFWRNLFAF